MTSTRLSVALPALVLALGGCGFVLAGCGQSGSSPGSLSLSQLPLISGASVVAQTRQCDSGANAFCAIEAVIVDRRTASSGALVTSEQRRLRQLGWMAAAGDNGKETADDSPGQQVRVTYATAEGDLTGIDLGWIKRPWVIEWSLSRAMFQRLPAMSIMLEQGPE